MTRDEVLNEARKMVKTVGSQAVLAERAGLTPTYVSQNIRGLQPLQPAFLDAIGFERVETYQRKARVPLPATLDDASV